MTPLGFLLAAAMLATSVALHSPWLPTWAAAALLGVIGLRVVQRLLWPVRVHVLVRLVLTAGIAMVVWAQFVPLGNRAVFAALLAAMLVLKLVETESIRDARVLVTFSCFLAMSAMLFGQGPVQTAATALAVLLLFASLAELVPGPRGESRPRLRATLLFAMRLVLLSLPFAAIAFVAFPRLDAPLWRGADEVRRGRTGMSDRLEPGQLASVALDDTPVFRVTFDGPVPQPRDRYFRGLVFWSFDGSAWTGEGAMRALPPELAVLGPETAYDVIIDATDQAWVYLLDAPTRAPAGASIGGDFSARFSVPITNVTRYAGRSATAYRMQERLPAQLARWALRTGEGNPRAKALAQSWRAKHRANDHAIISEALAMIANEFTYSLDPPLLGADPVDDFLFSSRIGFCEHFASAFALLMRAAGIPTRVVAGYQGGYFNESGGHVTVLRSDAHAWTEVWLAGEGWRRVDPTAAVSPERIERGSLGFRGATGDDDYFATNLRDRWDLVGAWWTRAIVQFNALSQRELFARLGIERATWREMGLVLVAGGFAALALAVAIGFRPRIGPRDPVLEAWRRLGARLARAGVPRHPSEGPRDYADRAAAALPAQAAPIRALSRRFVALRYASGTPEAERAAFVRDARAFRPGRIATFVGPGAS
ncbi:MAG TPA: DUF3488 and transglutaminase-like domain-containing protein [Candidatus Saccharimonadia bacterium]|nr:DUF3488 and transglutaminase-like domain-containing protein [Candidatus Saccharimonadia bacterium]